MPPPAGVGVLLLLPRAASSGAAAAPGGAPASAPPLVASPAVHGISILETLRVHTRRAGATQLFDSAPVWLSEAGEGAARAVLLSASAPPAGDDATADSAVAGIPAGAAAGAMTPMGRQHELWREIPRLRLVSPDPSKHVKARRARTHTRAHATRTRTRCICIFRLAQRHPPATPRARAAAFPHAALCRPRARGPRAHPRARRRPRL
jgi:hypothetical protein